MIEISNRADCCGCGACRQICPVNCIKMEADQEGFLFPRVDKTACINCGACERVCPILNTETFEQSCTVIDNAACDQSSPAVREPFAAKTPGAATGVYGKPIALGGWIKDEKIRYDSSSGGAFTLFAGHILANGGIVFGAALGEDLTVRHIAVENKEDLAKLRGSKYVQSSIGNTYAEVKENLRQGRRVLFTGTPCQAAGLHSFLGNKKYENLYIVDFICHGTPSPKVFSDYMAYMEKKCGDRIVNFRFRLKDKNWNQTGLQLGTAAETAGGKFIRHYPAFRDPFMNGFLDDIYLRDSCYDCRFKTLPKYYADITIADFWGVDKCDPGLNDGKGTSLVLLNSEHGKELFDAVKDNFYYKEVEFEKAIRRNKSLIKSVKPNRRRAAFFADYSSRPYEQVQRKYMNPIIWAVHKAAGMAWNIIEAIVRAVLTPVLTRINPSWDEAGWEALFQFIRFAMVGVTNVLVSYTINITTLLILKHTVPGFRFDYIIANTTAFILSVLWSFHWNSSKVFDAGRTPRDKLKALLRSYASYAFSGIVLNNVLSTFWIHVAGVSKFLAPLLNIPVTMPVNFFILKKWAFRK